MLTYGYNVWIEATMLPFLGVIAVFLFLRYRTNAEINRRFRLLALSTFCAAFLEVSSTLLIDGWSHQIFVNLVIRTLYYASINLNAYYLMRYVEVYVHVDNPKFVFFNKILLASSFVVLILNLTPYTSGFFFIIVDDGGLFMGTYNTLWRSVVASGYTQGVLHGKVSVHCIELNRRTLDCRQCRSVYFHSDCTFHLRCGGCNVVHNVLLLRSADLQEHADGREGS